MPELDLCAIRDEEVEAWVEVRNAADPDYPASAEGVRRARALEATLEHFLAAWERRPVGAASCLEQGDLRQTDVAVAFLGVVPDARRQGVGTALYHAVSDHARALEKARLQCDVWENDLEGVRFLEHRGFVEVERFARVRLVVADARLTDAPPPAGVELVPLEGRAELARSMYETAREAYADMPSTDPIVVSFDDFRGWEVERPSLRRDLSFLAIADGEVIGFGTIDMHGDGAWHSLTAVRRVWRRRGIATAIKRAQIEAAKAAGVTTLTTFSELRNVPMRTLNERLGYRPLPDQIRMRGPLAP